jgi:hypothetical protein
MSNARVQSRIRVAQLMTLAAQLPPDPAGAWRGKALCRGLDPDLFYPVDVDDAAMPVRVCRRCPVRVACFREREPWGIWGGTTEWERSAFSRAAVA